MSKYSELDVINGAVDDIMGGRPVEDAIGEIGVAVDAALAKSREKDEQLRELMLYCGRTANDVTSDTGEAVGVAYSDIFVRLQEILDGEQ